MKIEKVESYTDINELKLMRRVVISFDAEWMVDTKVSSTTEEDFHQKMAAAFVSAIETYMAMHPPSK